jgi:hypothetical protein
MKHPAVQHQAGCKSDAAQWFSVDTSQRSARTGVRLQHVCSADQFTAEFLRLTKLFALQGTRTVAESRFDDGGGSRFSDGGGADGDGGGKRFERQRDGDGKLPGLSRWSRGRGLTRSMGNSICG